MTHPTNTTPEAGTGGAYGFVRSGYDKAVADGLTTDDMKGATVYGRDEETIGEISSLKLGTDGKITDAVIDVGGFLGIGAHPVMLPFGDLIVLRETEGTDLRVHLDTTKAKLEAMPKHTA